MNANISYDDRSAVTAKHQNKNQDDQTKSKRDPTKNRNYNNRKTIQTKTQDQKFFKKNEIGKTRKLNKNKPK